MCIVQDPVADRFFRTGPAEWRLAGLLDGSRTVDEAVRDLVEQTGEEFDPVEAREFVARLEALGFLAGRPATAVAAPAPHGDLLHLRLGFGDPDRLLGRLARAAGPLFHPAFVAFAAAAILGAAVVAVVRLEALETSAARLLGWPAALYLWLPALALTALHELAHGVACRRFGGAVHDLGVLVYYFQPCAYCDVSGAWMIPQRSRRLWVLGAGPFVEAFVWALAIFAWLLLPADGPAAKLAVGIAATSGLKTLFNLNPLLKFDGYYLLSDALGIPNLRARAFAHFRPRPRGTADEPPATPVERAVFRIYAPLAAAYTLAVLGGFAAWAYARLPSVGGCSGHALFWCAAAMVVGLAALGAWRRRASGSAAASRGRRS